MNLSRILDEFFVPPRIADPAQWEKFPSELEKLEVEASDGTFLRGSIISALSVEPL